mmetsp:Transcript_61974/g.174697  ORF Transcript_61974/g.174697 Transcript_61974/m.174697 type:complete len:223 (+) Transcript_61974:586-1254(+)
MPASSSCRLSSATPIFSAFSVSSLSRSSLDAAAAGAGPLAGAGALEEGEGGKPPALAFPSASANSDFSKKASVGIWYLCSSVLSSLTVMEATSLSPPSPAVSSSSPPPSPPAAAEAAVAVGGRAMERRACRLPAAPGAMGTLGMSPDTVRRSRRAGAATTGMRATAPSGGVPLEVPGWTLTCWTARAPPPGRSANGRMLPPPPRSHGPPSGRRKPAAAPPTA